MTRAESLVWKESPDLVNYMQWHICLLKATFQDDLSFKEVAEVTYTEELD